MSVLLIDLLVLAISLTALALFSEWVVRSGIRISRLLKISELTIGFILISVLTSLPELLVSMTSAAGGTFALSVGNVFGANVVDIALVLGLSFYIYPKKFRNKRAVKKLSTALLLSSGITIIFLLFGSVGRLAGIFLVASFFFFCYYLFREKLNIHETESIYSQGKTTIASKISRLHFEEKVFFSGGHLGSKERATAISFLNLLIGMVLVVFSAGFVVKAATSIAAGSGISESILGALVIALGTTLPELSIGLAAFRKGHIGLALGDSLGSTVTNLTLVLGSGLLISSASLNLTFFSTLALFSLLTNIAFWHIITTKDELGKSEGKFLLAIYSAFVLFLLASQLYLLKEELFSFVLGAFG
ncbi:MAG: sodium:calcium antiporter [archaeon]